jgi:hypothetical protein
VRGFDAAARLAWNAVMQEGRASRTAERVAMRRAAHQLYDDPPLVFTDPLTMRVLSEDARAELSKREEVERTLSLKQQAMFNWLAERVARAGEPFRLGFDPVE